MTIQELLKKYHGEVDSLDLELIIAHELKKTREFILAHTEYKLTQNQVLKIKHHASRRVKHEPLAYILGHKEFFGLDFKVNKHTLIPRPETELFVEEALKEPQTTSYKPPAAIIDIGTGSGNIIISLAKNLKFKNEFVAIDTSTEALKIAKYNAKKHKVDKKIKFIEGNLLEPILKNKKNIIPDTKYILLANLPYLSKEIYNATAPNVKKYEPKSALYSAKAGLDHYEKLLHQIKILNTKYQIQNTIFMEISPEQKPKITKLIKSHLPKAKLEFHKDLARKWRICKIII